MQRYGVVLQELRLEVMKHNTYLAAAVTPTTGEVLASPSSLHPNGLAQVQWRPSLERPQQSHGDSISGPSGTVDADSRGMGITGGTSTGIGSIFTDEGQDLSQIFGTDSLMFSGESLDSDIAHMAGWGHFDSLVSLWSPSYGGSSNPGYRSLEARTDWMVSFRLVLLRDGASDQVPCSQITMNHHLLMRSPDVLSLAYPVWLLYHNHKSSTPYPA